MIVQGRYMLAEHRIAAVTLPCPLRKHDHKLIYQYSLSQGANSAHMLVCPKQHFHFLLIPELYERTGHLPRYRVDKSITPPRG